MDIEEKIREEKKEIVKANISNYYVKWSLSSSLKEKKEGVKKKIKELREKKENVIYELSGVKGIDYERVRGSYNPTGEEEKKESLRLQLDSIEKQISEEEKKEKDLNEEIQMIEKELKETDQFVSMMDMASLVIDVLAKGMTYREACEKYGISISQIKKTIDDEIKKILKEKEV